MSKSSSKTGTVFTLSAAAADAVKRYGSAIKEHLVSLKGIDRDFDMRDIQVGKTILCKYGSVDIPVKVTDVDGGKIGVELFGGQAPIRWTAQAKDISGIVGKRSLEAISRSRVHQDYAEQNLTQQAGFSAEVKEVARRRAEEAIKGKRPTTLRTDDIPGHTNDQLIDIVSTDGAGNPVPGTGYQMKFVGGNAKGAVQTMLSSKKFQKYYDNDIKIMVPKGDLAAMREEISRRAASLENQIGRMRAGNADPAAIDAKVKQLEKCRTLSKNLRESKVTRSEALEARIDPARSVAKDILKNAHEAGKKQAVVGAAVGGGISIVRNAVDLYRGKIDAVTATKNVTIDAGGAAVISYGTATVGSVIKGAMQNSGRSALRAVSKTNMPAYIATAAWEVGKTMKSYFCGEIDSVQCLEELGEKGFTMVTGAMFAAVGQVVIPIPVVGALAGSMLGYALSSASYRVLLDSLKSAKLARAERLRIEKECGEAVRMLKEYRDELERFINEYLSETAAVFDEAFAAMKEKLKIGDVDGYLSSVNRITETCGKKPLAMTKKEVDDLMASPGTINI